MEKKCIICGHNEFNLILKIDNSSSSVAKLLKSNQLQQDKKIPLNLLECDNCKLCQLDPDNYVNDDFYEEYLMNVAYSAQSQAYQEWLSADFVDYFNLKGKKAFDIGCGDGEFATFLKYYGLDTVGVEPSKSFFELAKQKIKALNQYFNKNTSLEKSKYDAFVSKEVFEHLKNPNEVLRAAKLFLKPDGVGLIAVPSFLTTMKDNRFYDIFRDHTAYYTKYTLQYLLIKNNFEVVKVFHSPNQEYLIAYFKNNTINDYNLKLFKENYENYKQSVFNFFKQNQAKKIVAWGAGGRGIEFLSICDITTENIEFVIDSNPNKFNLYTPGSHILIKNPAEVNFDNIDIILITAVLYQDEIIKDLKDKYNYKNKIGTIAPLPRLIE